MKIHRVVFLIAAVWELLRFCALFMAVWITFRQILEADSQAVYWLLIFGNGGLLVAAALLFLYVDPKRFRVLLNLTRLGKILGLVSALLLIILEPIGIGQHFLPLNLFPYRIAPLSLLLVISVLDLILLFLLFSYQDGETPPTASQQDQQKEEPPLPEYRETVIPKS
ncbi:MAG: hypothetical protein JSV89_09740 [Spirochaetaceae bacterium]|nr:MAG: hypothetical protein JSV89_09740 [Spirochaetaceae bacterium]